MHMEQWGHTRKCSWSVQQMIKKGGLRKNYFNRRLYSSQMTFSELNVKRTADL